MREILVNWNCVKTWNIYPLRTPRTKLSMKNDPTTIRGMKNAQLNTLPRASLVWGESQCKTLSTWRQWPTQYSIGVQPSMVTHWNTVSMARMMLSKEVMPLLGPSHFSRQTDLLALRNNLVNNLTAHRESRILSRTKMRQMKIYLAMN